MKSFESFLAWNYLFARGKEALVWLITGIAILGVAFGVAALIIATGVLFGFHQELEDRILGVTAHAQIANIDRPEILNYDEYIKELNTYPEVTGVGPLIEEHVLIQAGPGSGARKLGAILKGIDPEMDKGVTNLSNSIVGEGTESPGPNEVVLGIYLSQQLGVFEGDKIQCITTRISVGAMSYQAKRVELTVVGLFKSGLYEVDASVAYVNIGEAAKIFGMPHGSCQQIQMKIQDPKKTQEFGEKLGAKRHPFYDARIIAMQDQTLLLQTWQELNPTFFAALKLEQIATFVFMNLIVMVAAFNIIGIIVMVVSKKTREIGLLQATGASPKMIRGIFIRVGFFLGVIGTAVGLSLGLGVCLILKYVFPIQLPEHVYNISALPIIIDPYVIGLTTICSLLICLGASLFPAYSASRLKPADALRYE